MQGVTEEGVRPEVEVGQTVDQKLTGKEKSVSGTFRHGEVNSQPCMSIVSSILTLVPGSPEQGTQPEKAGHDRMHVSGCRIISPDIRLEAANLLTAIREHDPFMTDLGRMYLDLAITCLDDARAREVRTS